jgi:site-specific DNA-methyltransferase (adenine-specific)
MKIVKKSRKWWWKRIYRGTVYRHKTGEIVLGDALTVLNSLRDRCADIIFLDPPFNLGKKYGRNSRAADRKNEVEYLKYMEQIIRRSAEVLRHGGALYLYHMPKCAIRLASIAEEHLKFRHWIALSMKNAFVRGRHLYPAHYALLYYTKGEPTVFNRPKIPLPLCRRCQKELRDYGGYRKYVGNGINLSDIWDDISPVRHNKYKHRSANELPQDITDRIVAISGVRGGLLIDPFVGSGTSLVSAIKQGVQFVACDLDSTSVVVAVKRITNRETKG